MPEFSDRVIRWFAAHGRKDLPWQLNPTPYRVWVSEIMLQQTQVTTVIPFFERFMSRFPAITELAQAPLDEVLHLWTGLGYYARARNLHNAARIIVDRHGAHFPDTVELLSALPGIGRSTAGAIVALAFDRPAAILDGNVKRVLSRCFAVDGWPEQRAVNSQLWKLAEDNLPAAGLRAYTQALMDLGATVCTRHEPVCQLCPLTDRCLARQADSIDQYPGRAPGKTLPVRRVTVHILQNEQQQVLLVKRPATGIWGGLWSLPESAAEPQGTSLPVPNLTVMTSQTLPVLRHSFSHFHLDITPVLSRVSLTADKVAEPGCCLWYGADQPARIGLAAPVKKLLEQLAIRTPDQ